MVLSGVAAASLQRAVQSKTKMPRWAAYLPKHVMPHVWHQHADDTQENDASATVTCDHDATSSVHSHGKKQERAHQEVYECGELALKESNGAAVAPSPEMMRRNVKDDCAFSDTATTAHSSPSFANSASSSPSFANPTEHPGTPAKQSQASFNDNTSCGSDTAEMEMETIVVERNTFLTVELLQRHNRRLKTTPA
jgi:hypothetical protein